MPRILSDIPTVRCGNCGRSQPDYGVRKTCSYCGFSPVPSRDYPRDSVFYPKPPTEGQQDRIERLVAQKRNKLSK